MKVLTSQYGKAIIAVLVILIIFTIIFGKFYTIPGTSEKGTIFESMNAISNETDDVIDDAENDTSMTTKLSQMHSTSAPTLEINKSTCYKNTEYDVTTFASTDSNCALVINSVDYLTGNGKPYTTDGKKITFKQTGTYRLQITSTSKSTNLKTLKDVEVSVQKKL